MDVLLWETGQLSRTMISIYITVTWTILRVDGWKMSITKDNSSTRCSIISTISSFARKKQEAQVSKDVQIYKIIGQGSGGTVIEQKDWSTRP